MWILSKKGKWFVKFGDFGQETNDFFDGQVAITSILLWMKAPLEISFIFSAVQWSHVS